MAIETTLSIVKPDGVRNKHIGDIIDRFERAGLDIIAMKLKRLSRAEAEGFYAEHKERTFFGELVEFMTSGPVVLMILEGENAVEKNRELMGGATDPAKATPGSIRAMYAASIGENTVHGSDKPQSAARETAWFFAGTEIARVAR